MPGSVAGLPVEECKPGNAPRLLFSAMDASVATEIERAFAQAGHVVVSNSKNHRMDPDVPLLVPEVNPDHLKLIPGQQRNRGWKGQIVTNPNCSTIVLTMALGPLKTFGITRVITTTLQAISGAGYPGVASMDITANVIPYIGGEEEKMQQETQKILGDFRGDHIEPLHAKVSAHCNRVPVVDGHTVTVSVEFSAKPSEADLRHAFDSFAGVPQQRRLPSAPPHPVIYMDEKDRPQPRRDAEREHGMAAFIGRLRPCPVLDYKFVALSHNTVRGAAGAAVLNAELMHSEGMLD
jgi:aspartate-semialdehyde dehydrogenase